MIKFKSVTVRNFLSVGNTPLEFHLDKDPITLVTGPSGSGKSTILLAICFALFGKTPRRIKKTGYANSINKKNTETTLCIEKNGVSFEILRGLNPAILEISIDGVLQEKSAASKDDQDWLENLIGINYETFCQTILISIMGYQPFLTLDAAKRREVVDNIFGLSVFTNMVAVYKTQLSELNEKINAVTSTKAKLESNAEIITKGILDAERSAFENAQYIETELSKIQAAVTASEEGYKDALSKFDQSKYSSFQKDRLALNQKSAEAVSAVEAIKSKGNVLKAELQKWKTLTTDTFTSGPAYVEYVEASRAIVNNTKSVAEWSMIVKSSESMLANVKKQLDKAKGSPHECSSCGQKLTEKHLLEFKNTISKLEEEIQSYIDQKADASGKIAYLQALEIDLKNNLDVVVEEIKTKHVNETTEKLKDLAADFQTAKDALAEITLKLEVIDVEWNSLVSAKENVTKSEALHKSSKDKLDGVMKMKEKLDSTSSTDIDSKKLDLKKLEKSISVVISEVKTLTDTYAEYVVVGKLLKDSGLKALMMKQYLDMTNSLMQKYIEMFNLDVKFSFDENFGETIKSRGRDEYEYFSLSSGERMRLDLAMLFTWRELYKIRTGSGVNVLFFDEVFDSSLDSDGRASLIPIFENLRQDTNVVIISHSPEHLAENDVQHITVKKLNGFSQYKAAE